MQSGTNPFTFWQTLAEYPLFVLRLFTHPGSLLASMDFKHHAMLPRLSLFVLISLAIVTFAFADNRILSDTEKPRLSTFKGSVMRAHDRSWDWMEPVYGTFNLGQGEAKRLWDTLLTSGFLTYTMFAALLAIALVARLRMWRFGMEWEQAIGTALLGLVPSAACAALSLVPLTLLLICRHCAVRLALFILLNIAAWAYLGYYTLGDLGEHPRGISLLIRSIAYGLLHFVIAYAIFLILIAAILPI